jgi:hypothetical protein
MQSFHHSRGKIVFEVCCALAVSASCVGAWMQTGAWAMLAVASVAALYGFTHVFALRPRRPAPLDRANIGPAIGLKDGVLIDDQTGIPVTATDRQSTTKATIEKADPAAGTNGLPATKGCRTKTGRKSGDRRTKGAKETKVTQLAPAGEAEINAPKAVAEEAPFPLVPLFEPQPFMRQPRVVFGRKDNFA